MNGKQKEILLIAQEECAEVTQAISNRERLCEEVGDLLCMIELMIVNKIINSDDVDEARKHKLAKLKTWSNIFGEKNE